MKKKILSLLLCGVLACGMLVGCGNSDSSSNINTSDASNSSSNSKDSSDAGVNTDVEVSEISQDDSERLGDEEQSGIHIMDEDKAKEILKDAGWKKELFYDGIMLYYPGERSDDFVDSQLEASTELGRFSVDAAKFYLVGGKKAFYSYEPEDEEYSEIIFNAETLEFLYEVEGERFNRLKTKLGTAEVPMIETDNAYVVYDLQEFWEIGRGGEEFDSYEEAKAALDKIEDADKTVENIIGTETVEETTDIITQCRAYFIYCYIKGTSVKLRIDFDECFLVYEDGKEINNKVTFTTDENISAFISTIKSITN